MLSNIPMLDEVREKIERRYANALSVVDLAQSSVQGGMIEVEQAGVRMIDHSRLEQIHASVRGEILPTRGTAALPGITPVSLADSQASGEHVAEKLLSQQATRSV